MQSPGRRCTAEIGLVKTTECIAGQMAWTTLNDLPDVILSNIVAFVSDTRTRNSLSLVCRKFLSLERATRFSLTLRGNARDLFMIPSCFRSVTKLDLSLLSPWGHALLCSSRDAQLLAHRLSSVFPLVTSLTVYARSPMTLQILVPKWPLLRHVKLVRWHQRPQLPPGADLAPVFEHLPSLSSLDLSEFYCWTEDIAPVLQQYPITAKSITKLDLLTRSFTEGFRSVEIQRITEACPNLKQLLMACMFDPRYNDCVGDEALLAIAAHCPKLTLLHLADTTTLANGRGDQNADGITSEDAKISPAALAKMFAGIPLLEELVLDVAKNVRDSGPAFEALNSRCPRLRKLKVGQLHGICLAIESQLDGIALCQGLVSLSIKNSADLTDMGLIEIGRGCCRLSKFEIERCNRITVKGLRTLVSLIRRTLLDVKISCCKNLNAEASLQALEPIQSRIQRLHIDCMWQPLEEEENDHANENVTISSSFDLNEIDKPGISSSDSTGYGEDSRGKRCKYSMEGHWTDEVYNNGNELCGKRWDQLKFLSLWISVGELLTPLQRVGLEDCPILEEIHIEIEGDCRGRPKPSELAFGLSSLDQYPLLSKMKLDCSDTIGFALTAPRGQMDLSLWERFFLNGIGNLGLNELDYWPPQDQSFNQRSLSHPAAGLLAESLTLRKLFIHGTAYEHFMMFLLRIQNLRDVQLRLDYYPAPENDMSTEMRVDSCSRFEDALNSRQIQD